MSLPEFSIHRPVTVITACLIAVILGGIAFMDIPIDLMPETEYPTLSINVSYPGVAPEEMETLVARPLEQVLASAPNAEEITSSSSEGRSSVRVEFGYGIDLDEAANDLRTRVDRRRDLLPDDIEPPTLYKYDVSQYPVMYLTVSSDKLDSKQLRHFGEKNIQYRMERVVGVAQARVSGGLRRQIHVNLNLEKLRALDLSVAQVVAKLRRENLNRPVGPVREGDYEVLLRTQGEFRNLDEILSVSLATRNGVPVYLRDIAGVTDDHEEVRYIVTVNGAPAVRMFIYKQSGANTVEVSEGVHAEIAKLREDYDHVNVEAAWDSAEFITASIENVQTAALVGSAFAIAVLLFFLRSFSSTLIIGIAIPISVISTFALMYFNGFTLNTVSFGGLALGVGMLVDNAIVVLENIFRLREKGKSPIEAAVVGSRQVGMAITASTLTTIAVFVPVLFMQGMAAQTFKQLAWVVSFALMCSLLVALTIVPMLSARYLRPVRAGAARGRLAPLSDWIGRAQDRLSEQYGSIISWALDHRAVVVLTAASLFAGAYYLTPLIGVELEPEVDEGQIEVDLELAPGTHVVATNDTVQRIRQIIEREAPEVRSIMTEAGSQSSWRAEGTNNGELRLDLVDRSERTRSASQIVNALRPMLDIQPGMTVRVRVRSGVRRRGGGFEDESRLSVEIRGHDMLVSQRLAEEVRNAMLRIPGIVNAVSSRKPGNPEVLVRVDRQKASSMGLDVSEVADTLETAVGGTRASFFREEGDEYDIMVRLREEDRLSLEDVGQVPIMLPNGEMIRAESIVSVDRQEGPFEITRADQQRIIVISGTIADRDLGSVANDLKAEMALIDKPGDYELRLGSEYEDQQEAFQEMTFAAIMALVLVYMVMSAQFESFRDPFIILFSVPLALVGIVLILLLTETTFNIQGFLGVIVLVGIVVNNAIVLLDYTKQLYHEHGYALREAVIQAGARRLRPILMTTVTTVLGLVPMALGLGEGGELQAPLARVVVGGLLTSTMITLVIIPVIYMTLEERTAKARERSQALPAGAEPHPVASSGD